MRSNMVPGAIFPDYELSDHTAKHRKLSELQGQDPMVAGSEPRRSTAMRSISLKDLFKAAIKCWLEHHGRDREDTLPKLEDDPE